MAPPRRARRRRAGLAVGAAALLGALAISAGGAFGADPPPPGGDLPIDCYDEIIMQAAQRNRASAAWGGLGAAKTGLLNYANSSTSATGRRGFCGQFLGSAAPTDNSMTGTSSSASANSRATASASKPIIGVEPRPSAWAA